MKEKLEALSWRCSRCNCPGKKGWDCVNNSFRGVMIALKTDNYFRITKSGHVITSGFAYELEQKLKENGLV